MSCDLSSREQRKRKWIIDLRSLPHNSSQASTGTPTSHPSHYRSLKRTYSKFLSRYMGDCPGSESTCLRVRLESALHAYEETAGVILAEHPLAVELQSCHSVESSATVLTCEAQSLGDPLGGSDRIIRPIERIVPMLFTLSSTNLGDADGLVRQQVMMGCQHP